MSSQLANSPGLTECPLLLGPRGQWLPRADTPKTTFLLGLQPSRRPLPGCARVRVSLLCTPCDEGGKKTEPRSRSLSSALSPVGVTLDSLFYSWDSIFSSINGVWGGLEGLLGPFKPWLFGLCSESVDEHKMFWLHQFHLTPSLTGNHAQVSTPCQA